MDLERKRILVVGMSGLVGGLVGPKLAERHEVQALNRSLVPGYQTYQADIANLADIRPAFEGVDTVINMAAHTPDNRSQTASDDEDVRKYVATNLIGAYNVFEAAKDAKVKRVVFASAGASVFNYVMHEPYKAFAEARWNDIRPELPKLSHLAPYRPNGIYGTSKAWAEALGRFYADIHGMSVICVRVGYITRPPQDEYDLSSYQASIYCSHRDIIQMFNLCVEAPEDLRYDVFFACSNNRGLFRDIEHPRQAIGYVPQDGIKDWPLNRPGV